MKQDLQYFCTKMLKEHQVKSVVVGGYSMRPSCHEMPWVIVSFPESFQKGFLIFLIVFCFFGRDNWTMQSTFNAYSILASSVCPGIFLNKGNGSICIHHQNGQAAHAEPPGGVWAGPGQKLARGYWLAVRSTQPVWSLRSAAALTNCGGVSVQCLPLHPVLPPSRSPKYSLTHQLVPQL